jgi:hypothetical protein
LSATYSCLGEDGSDIEDVYEETEVDADSGAKSQLDGELNDKLNDDEELAPSQNEDSEDHEDRETKAEADDENEEDDEDEDKEGEEGEEYSVETIQNHKWYKGQLLYWIKWKGYPASQNTWEPEGHLLPYDQ